MSQVTLFSHCSLDTIREEAHCLVRKGCISRQQPIYTLCQFISPRDWPEAERELERNGYLLRDAIADLFPKECWEED